MRPYCPSAAKPVFFFIAAWTAALVSGCDKAGRYGNQYPSHCDGYSQPAPSDMAFDASGSNAYFVAGGWTWGVYRVSLSANPITAAAGTQFASSLDTANFYPIQGPQSANAIALDATDSIYVAGTYAVSSSVYHWVVRKSSDQGVTWSTVDDFQRDGAGSADARAIAVDASGNLFVAGYANTPDAVLQRQIERWTVRKSSDGGKSWTTLDMPPINGIAQALLVAPDGTLYAGGSMGLARSGVNPTTDSYRWAVRKSANQGVSWTPSDDFLMNDSSSLYSLAMDSNGVIYAAGASFFAQNTASPHGLIRKSADAGLTWATVFDHDFGVADPSYPPATSILGADAAGNLFHAWSYNEACSNMHWSVRESADQARTWSTTDDLTTDPWVTGDNAAQWSLVGVLRLHPSGEIYAAGLLPSHGWGIRKSSDHGVTWQTVWHSGYVGPMYAGSRRGNSDPSFGKVSRGLASSRASVIGECLRWFSNWL